MKWGQLYTKIGEIRHKYDVVAHHMVSGCHSVKDDVSLEELDTLIEELSGELMELSEWRENLS